jgi:hypothetical protein
MCTVLGGKICFAFEVVRPFFFAFAALVFEEATGGVLLSGVFIVVMLIFLWSGEERDALHYIDDAFYRCDTQIKVGTIEV